MKQIRDKVAGLDVHRDTVVACCRIQQPDRSIDVTKRSFATTVSYTHLDVYKRQPASSG